MLNLASKLLGGIDEKTFFCDNKVLIIGKLFKNKIRMIF